MEHPRELEVKVGHLKACSTRERDREGKREWRRVSFRAAVTVLHPRPAVGVTLDVSVSGMRIVVDTALCPGERCIVQVRLPEGGFTHERAHVVWSRLGPYGWEAGLRFAATT